MNEDEMIVGNMNIKSLRRVVTTRWYCDMKYHEPTRVVRSHKYMFTLSLRDILDVLIALHSRPWPSEIVLPAGTHLMYDHLLSVEDIAHMKIEDMCDDVSFLQKEYFSDKEVIIPISKEHLKNWIDGLKEYIEVEDLTKI